MTSYSVEYLEQVISDDIPVLPKSVKNQIIKAIQEKLAVNPVVFGKPLRHSLKGYRRLRVGDWRIVYRIEKQTVVVTAIQHRKGVYE